jgi:hypothetical protein
MMVVSTLSIGAAFLLSFVVPCAAQFDSTAWRFSGELARVERYDGRESLMLRDALAYLPTAHFRTGTIDFDVSLPDAASFVGIQFRMQGALDYEDYYFRPMNSGAGDATQYQPVFHGNTGWQIYVGPRFTAPIRLRPGAWMHVRLRVAEDRAAVYVDGDSMSQYIPRLLGPRAPGIIALYARFAAAHFANVHVDTTAVDVPIRAVARSEVPRGAVSAWSVSDAPIDEAAIVDRLRLDATILKGVRWTTRPATERGIVNLGEIAAKDEHHNTLFARLTINSARARSLPFRLGFSDRARVYLNSSLIFTADDTYRSRDPRFLGTVGLYDTVVLSLRPGENTLVVAVSETSGGWAVAGAADSIPGVTISATGTP